ncbi:LuxR C-terminal-related transcriptional regulator [Streptomyces sp. NPDC048637]|uniref:ATP-binding protein n=1 Tax=Streptomyces sp. NPDC048637 TaxID=3155636 RepID=UPI0034382CF2
MGYVPAEVTSFVGRRSELRSARHLLTRTRLLTLTGAGGIGKTRLAIRLASEVRRSFPGGAWVVDLAPLEDGDLLAQTVLAALGFDHDATRPALSALAGHLADRQLLLVLDNCEHLLDPCALLTHTLLAAAPGLQVLATSRQALGIDGECLLAIEPLSTPAPDRLPPPDSEARYEAVQLFADRAAAVLPAFTVGAHNRVTVARICHRLDGIPLAVELAAARLRALSLEQILVRLDDRFGLLTQGSRAALPRRQTLRAAIDWSFELCTAHEQRLWMCLSVFSGGFDLEAAEAVCAGALCAEALSAGEDTVPARILDGVAGLVDKSVLTREEHPGRVRFRMLETIRQYGRDHLRDRGEERAVRRRHRDYYQQLAARAEAEWFGPQQLVWFARLRLDRANLRAALEFGLSTPEDTRAGLRLASSLWSHWLGSGGFEGAERHWLGRALARDTERGPERAKALWVDGWLALLHGDMTTAHARLAECGALARELGDEGACAHAVQFAGLAALFEDDYPRAVPLLEDALDRHRANGALGAQWTTLFLLTLACCLSGDPRAAALGGECLALCDTHGARWSRSYALWVLGLQQWLTGETGRAIALLQEGLHLEAPAHNHLAVAQCLEVLAWAVADDGGGEQAATLLGAAQTAWQAVGAPLPGVGRLLIHHTECEALLRRSLGDALFATAVRAGAALTLDEAVARALGRPPSPEAHPHQEDLSAALTRRERQVVALVAEGLTDKQIAARLVISPRTAEGHVQRILVKFGFTSRTQIVTWAVEQRTALA